MQRKGRGRLRLKRIVLPGEKIGVIEEFLLGEGTYEEEGVIRSQVLGEARLDLERKLAVVRPRTRTPIFPREGSKVVGEVGEKNLVIVINKNNDVKISYNDFIIKAVAIALTKFPVMTGQLSGDTIKLANTINIGLAIAVPGGLVAPILKEVEKKK